MKQLRIEQSLLVMLPSKVAYCLEVARIHLTGKRAVVMLGYKILIGTPLERSLPSSNSPGQAIETTLYGVC